MASISPPLTLKLLLALALSNITLSSSALAAPQGEQYFGVQYASTTFEIGGDLDWSPKAIIGRFGSFLNDHVALEGRLGIGIGSDTVTGFLPGFGIVDIEVELDTLFGIYGVGHHAVNDNLAVYALLGLSRGEATLSATGAFVGSESDTETDLSYGFGVNFGVSNTIALNLEYISYISKSDFDVTAINLGFVSKF